MLPKLLELADKLVEDLQKEYVQPHTDANLHLISFFKEAGEYEKGARFWSWLAGRDTRYIDGSVYGAAIELLAYAGKSLVELEDIYRQALQRYPGTFAEYHLSPTAVVPDRRKQTIIHGLPMTLLQGILTARLLHGDWQNAYLAFDTALRLFPGQVPPRFYELLIYERPLPEAYKVFMIACRSGVILQPILLNIIMDKLAGDRKSAKESPPTLREKSNNIKALLMALHAYVGAEGTISGRNLGVIVKGIAGLLPEEVEEPDLQYVASTLAISTILRRLIMTVVGAGILPDISTFNNLITMAARAKQPHLAKLALDDMLALKMESNAVTFRAMVLAAGSGRSFSAVQAAWETLVEDAETQGKQPELKDWQALGKACAGKSEGAPYVEEQAARLEHAITPDIESYIHRKLQQLQNDTRKPSVSSAGNRLPSRSDVLEIENSVARIEALIRFKEPHDFRNAPLPMSMDPNFSLKDEANMRSVYDQYTSDHSKQESVETFSDLSPTGLPLDELRFQNWVSVSELLLEAEDYEKRKKGAVEEAIASGTPVRVKSATSVSQSDDATSSLDDASKGRITELLRLRLLDS